MKINAYAKVNLILNVLGKRPDGYHELESLMHAISLCDEVELEILPAGTLKSPVTVSMSLNTVAPEDNLAYRAALAAKEALGIKDDISIKITKHIPMAAGLGGGSADAAAVIAGLAQTAGFSDLEALMKLGKPLGSDVPFCIAAQLGNYAAIARGTGTELEFIEPLDLAMNIDFPKETIPNKTGAVYRELKPADYEKPFSIEAFIKAENYNDRIALMGNHLQAPAERLMGIKVPEGSMLCGAGPSVLTLTPEGSYRCLCKNNAQQ